MIIYIAGKYSEGDTVSDRKTIGQNIGAADRAARDILARGHIPICVHKMTAGWERDKRFTYEHVLQMDFKLLELCDAILVISTSSGVMRELAYAGTLDREMKVYRSMGDIPFGDNKRYRNRRKYAPGKEGQSKEVNKIQNTPRAG